jgi:hypothetical protein
VLHALVLSFQGGVVGSQMFFRVAGYWPADDQLLGNAKFDSNKACPCYVIMQCPQLNSVDGIFHATVVPPAADYTTITAVCCQWPH